MARYGILGFGHHAVRRLMQGFAGASDSNLVGMWRRDAAKAQENAREYSIPHVFETPLDLCKSQEIDVVFVASPDALHLEHTLLAARHGKHVLCEKPLAMNIGEAERMQATAENHGVRLGVAQNMRYNRSLARMREWISEGTLGKPVLAQAQFAYSAKSSPRTWIYNPTLALGGPIGDVGIHCIDALRYVLNTDVRAVATIAHVDEHSGSVESHAVVGLEFTSGVTGAVTVTTRSAYRTLVEVTCEHGVILCENGLTVDFPVEAVMRRGSEVLIRETISNADAYSRMLDGFSAWIKGHGQYLAPGIDGLHNQRVLDAAYQSWRDGVRINLA